MGPQEVLRQNHAMDMIFDVHSRKLAHCHPLTNNPLLRSALHALQLDAAHWHCFSTRPCLSLLFRRSFLIPFRHERSCPPHSVIFCQILILPSATPSNDRESAAYPSQSLRPRSRSSVRIAVGARQPSRPLSCITAIARAQTAALLIKSNSS
eukprot:1792051-Rhodomonas_salina.3